MCGIQTLYQDKVRQNRGQTISLQDDINDAQLEI